MVTPLSGVARPKVARMIGLTRSAETQLADALTLLADRHDREADVRDMLTRFARWTRARIERIDERAGGYGEIPSEHPERLRASLYYGTRMGGIGLVQDLQDLLVQHHEVATFYVTVQLVAQELRDEDLEALLDAHHIEVERQLAWVKTRLKRAAPQAIVVPSDVEREVAASVPKRPSVVAQPDVLWAPIAAALSLAVVGALALVSGMPVLLPSLGPTAYLVAESPAHPQSRFGNMLFGHLAGVIAGIAAVAIARAGSAPPLLTGDVTPPRVVATVLAIALLFAISLPLRISHPPAAATALLISIGVLRTTTQLEWLVIGVVVLALVGELLRNVRLRHLPTGPEPTKAQRARSLLSR